MCLPPPSLLRLVSACIIQEAYARRGAHWTFDAEAFVKCVGSIRNTGAAQVPSFDHGIGDPVPGDIRVTPEHGIVLVEGNYLYLGE
jgi:pantothenate kinase